jgi:hypothetical protein
LRTLLRPSLLFSQYVVVSCRLSDFAPRDGAVALALDLAGFHGEALQRDAVAAHRAGRRGLIDAGGNEESQASKSEANMIVRLPSFTALSRLAAISS